MIDQTLNNIVCITIASNIGESKRKHCFRIVQSRTRHDSGKGTYGAPGTRAPPKITTCSLCPPPNFYTEVCNM